MGFISRFFAGVFVVFLSGCTGFGSGLPALPSVPEEEPVEELRKGGGTWFISAANPYAAAAGADILRRGGSAVDAAIATQAVLGLVEPQSSGFGGGGFMLHYDPLEKTVVAYDGRETAPASARPDRFLKEDGTPMQFYDAVTSGLSVGVPGVVRMLEMAHRDYGITEWSRLFDYAVALSAEGFEVSPRLESMIGTVPGLKRFSAAASYFHDDEMAPLQAGEVLANPAYARTLRMIADNGADALYTGEIAEAIVKAVNEAPSPGGMTLEDLAGYRPVKRVPVCGEYRTSRVCSMGPPSSGGVTALQILSLLERFDMAAYGPQTVESLHLLFEASRLAYADRNRYLADNDMLATGPYSSAQAVVHALLDPGYLAARSALIDPDRAAVTVTPGDPALLFRNASPDHAGGYADDASPEPPSTTHFVIVDSAGRVVSMTGTVEFLFGSHLMAAGMILNNQLTDFSFLPEKDGRPVANAPGGGKRPRSSMTPVILFDEDGRFRGALGSPGGPAIIGYAVKTLLGIIDWNLSVQEAVDLPNAVYPRGAPLLEEGRFDDGTVNALRLLGHNTGLRLLGSGIHAVGVRPDGTYDGGADPRREGVWLTGEVDP